MKKTNLRSVVKILVLLSLLGACKDEEFYKKDFIETIQDENEIDVISNDKPIDSFPETEPEMSEPEVTEPEVTEPEVTEPEVTEPEVTEPEVTEPEVTEPEVTEPEVTEPEVAEPEVTEPEVTEPEVTEPEVTEPEVSEPEVAEPEVEEGFTEVVDSFNQKGEKKKIDIVWVVDDSGSMGDEQKALGDNFDAFIKEFVTKDIDFQMAITTTDTHYSRTGKAVAGSIENLNSSKLNQNESLFMQNFADMINVGTWGSGTEKGLKASSDFAWRYGKTFVRDGAYLAVVYVSDEEDQSEKSVSDYLTELQSYKSNKGLLKAYSIVDMSSSGSSSGLQRGHARYKEISDKTAGSVSDIKSDFYTTLLDMGEEIANLTEQFPLSQVPHNSKELMIKINGSLSSSWTYIASSNSIKFDKSALPQDGDSIIISYKVQD